MEEDAHGARIRDARQPAIAGSLIDESCGGHHEKRVAARVLLDGLFPNGLSVHVTFLTIKPQTRSSIKDR